MYRILNALVVFVAAATAVSCGGSDGRSVSTPGPAPSFTASFTADNSAPGNNTVALSLAPGGGGDLVAVNVGVSGVNDVFAASFRIAYDPALVNFQNWSAGSLLETSGNGVLYQVAVVSPGVVEVGVSCVACSSGIDVSTAQTVIQMIFRATATGNSALTFVTGDLLDSQSPPTPISGLNWAGGTVTGG